MSLARERALPPMTLEGAPDWADIDHACPCSRCGYELRMREEPRCPECGLEFSWPVYFLEQREGASRWFEHQWKRRPVRSWIGTAWAGLNPWRFWRHTDMHTSVDERVLWLIVVFSPMIALLLRELVILFVWVGDSTWRGGMLDFGRGGWKVTRSNWFNACLTYHVQSGWLNAGILRELPRVMSASIAMAISVMAILCLRQTLGRGGVRRGQLVRVVALASIPTSLIAGVLWLAASLATYASAGKGLPGWVLEPLGNWLRYLVPAFPAYNLVPALFFAVSVGVALRVYLKLPRAVWIVPGIAAIFATSIVVFHILRAVVVSRM